MYLNSLHIYVEDEKGNYIQRIPDRVWCRFFNEPALELNRDSDKIGFGSTIRWGTNRGTLIFSLFPPAKAGGNSWRQFMEAIHGGNSWRKFMEDLNRLHIHVET